MGGNEPIKFQSVIDKPECVKRVMHPTTTITYTKAQPLNNHQIIGLSRLLKELFSIMICKITQHLNTKKINLCFIMKISFFRWGIFAKFTTLVLMLKKLAYFILKYRLSLLFTVIAISVVMGFFGLKVEIAYNNPRLLPSTDSASIDYDFFKSKFGQDGTILVVGIKKDELNTLANYNAWVKAGDDIKSLAGIKNVLSLFFKSRVSHAWSNSGKLDIYS